ncbi:MAG: response regulator [Nitrospinae bacterium]|nr:response regulator [Nitrospinota bacterium]
MNNEGSEFKVPVEVKGSSILLADDDEISLFVLSSYFEAHGFTCFKAENGAAALDILMSNHVDVVLSDLRMPEISGLEFLARAKQKYPSLVFIILSGFRNIEAAVDSIKGGAEDYIVKPCEPQRAMTTVVRALQRKKLQDENKRLEAERQKAEAALRETEKKYRQLVENANDLIYTHDLQGVMTSVNHVATSLTGYSIEEIIGTDYKKFLALEFQALAEENMGAKLAGKTETTRYEVEIVAKDGRRVPLELSTRLIYKDGAPVGVQAICRDMTERNKAEAALRTAKEQADEATKLKDKFVSLVSHDLRSPIATVSGCLNIIKSRSGESMEDGSRQILDRALGTCDGMVKMIDQLLNISRLKTGKIKLVRRFIDAHPMVAGALDGLSLIAGNKGVTLVNHVPPRTRLFVDYNLFYQVAQNLVSNAVKFCPAGGSVTAFVPEKSKGVLAVKDTGVGIDQKIIPDLFRHEVKTTTIGTAGEKGTGLGLPLCKDIMEAHSGNIVVESEPGKGSVFYLSLPEVKPVVLVASGDDGIRGEIASRLSGLETELVEVDSGLSVLQTASARQPHLVILDSQMRGDGGREVISLLRASPEWGDTPIMMILGDHNGDEREKMIKLGAHDCIPRPINGEELVPRVRRFIF